VRRTIAECRTCFSRAGFYSRAYSGQPSASDWFLDRARQLGVEHKPPGPILLGRHLLELGAKPGPRVGEILKAVYEQQLDGSVTTL
jgi:tRNA nucleotidyltransferase (CCA-adding enzyme)